VSKANSSDIESKRGVLGIQKTRVRLGAEPTPRGLSGAQAHGPRRCTRPTILKLLHDEVDFCRKVTHAIIYREQP
jgi:hypothetical protein